MRDIKFRAWAEHKQDTRWEYAWNKSEEEYIKIEPSNYTSDWDNWYYEKEQRRGELLLEWDNTHTLDERYFKSFQMINKIMVNGEAQHTYGYEIIDIMQYTGLKDKNGVDIYEGDILANNQISFKVYYDNGMFQLKGNDSQDGSHLHRDRALKLVVIGNIYENAGLLNQPKEENNV